MRVRLAPMLKLSHPISSLLAGRTLRAWLTHGTTLLVLAGCCLLYTSDAADECCGV